MLSSAVELQSSFTDRLNCTAPTAHPGLSRCCCSEGTAPFLQPHPADGQHVCNIWFVFCRGPNRGILPGQAQPELPGCLQDRSTGEPRCRSPWRPQDSVTEGRDHGIHTRQHTMRTKAPVCFLTKANKSYSLFSVTGKH